MFHLPTRAGSQRVKVWRKLRKFGAVPWKSSGYFFPNTPEFVERLHWLLEEIRKFRGDGSVVRVAKIEGCSDRQMTSLCNQARRREYQRLIHDLQVSLRNPAWRSGTEGGGSFARLTRRFEEIATLDVFGCPLRAKAEALLKERQAGGERLDKIPPGVPSREKYRGRLWMTRPRPEVDRVASAWLIRHFVDAQARFIFSSDPHAHAGALRFDMFEGEFTHVGDDCTFETLVKHLHLRDRRLRVIAQIVHDADLEDNKFGREEGKAIHSVLRGWGKMGWPDEEILRRGFDLFEGLYNTLER